MRFYITLHFLLITSYGQRTYDIIPKNYSSDVAPVVNTAPASIYISCQILGIDNINEATMDFRLIAVIISVWKDPRLNLKQIASDHAVILPNHEASKIWKPSLGFANSKIKENFEDCSRNDVVKVLPDESLFTFLRANFLVDCPMELRDFPMDIQTCIFQISFDKNTDREAIMKWMGEDGSPYKYLGKSIHIRSMNLLKFEMNEVKAKKYTSVWVTGNFTTLMAEFTFIRRLTGNVMNVYIPSTLVVMLSWLSFWIDVKASPARITLGVTSILTLVTHLVQSRSFVPPVDYLKALDIWFIFCIALVFFSLLEYAVAYHFINEIHEVKKVDRQRFHSDPKEETTAGVMKVWISYLRDKTHTLIHQKGINVYDKVSRCLFPVVFTVFATSYWIYYLACRAL